MYIYKCVIERFGKKWRARVPALPGVISIGATRNAVIAAAKEAIENYLETLSDDDKAIPVETVSNVQECFIAADPLLKPQGTNINGMWSVSRSRGRSVTRSAAGTRSVC
jgi:predicted RNase H-like HicB family nuclease